MQNFEHFYWLKVEYKKMNLIFVNPFLYNLIALIFTVSY